jgi:amidase
MKRRDFITSSSLAAAGLTSALAISCNTNPSPAKEEEKKPTNTDDNFALNEITVAELQDKVQKGEYTYEQITDMYLQRIDA